MFKKFKIFGVSEAETQEINLDYQGEENEEYLDDENYEEEENIGQIALDILDSGEEIIILAPVAGIDFKDVDLSFYNQVLTISGVRKKPDFYNEEIFIKNSECYWGKFSRKIILPENLDFDNIKARMENNLLMIFIKKLHFSNQNIKIDKIY